MSGKGIFGSLASDFTYLESGCQDCCSNRSCLPGPGFVKAVVMSVGTAPSIERGKEEEKNKKKKTPRERERHTETQRDRKRMKEEE